VKNLLAPSVTKQNRLQKKTQRIAYHDLNSREDLNGTNFTESININLEDGFNPW